MNSTTRRTFLAAAATPALGAAWQRSPSDRIRLGQIGAGVRAGAHLSAILESDQNAATVAVCDVWSVNRERTSAAIEKAFGAAPKQTSRYQELLEMNDVDAVLIATPDFTHPQILIDAVAAGKDVYVEKPFAVDFADGKRAWQAVKQSDRVVQVGTQRRSNPTFIGAAKAVQDGVIGKVTRVATEVHYQQQRWQRPYDNVRAEDVDWEAFRFGGRVAGGFDPRKLREWQLFEEMTSGIAGLWMCHLIDLAPWFLQDPYPRQAATMGGVYLWKDGRRTSDVFQSMVEYDDCLVTFSMSLTNGAGNRNLWFGTKGTMDIDGLHISGDGSEAPDRVEAEMPIEEEPLDDRTYPGDGTVAHMANFLQCVRSRQTPRAPVDAGFQHATPGCMAAVSLHEGRRVRFDRERMEIV